MNKHKVKLTNDIVDERLRLHNPTVIRRENFKGSSVKIEWACVKCNNVWLAVTQNVISGNYTGCPTCNGNKKYTISEIDNILYKKNIHRLTDYNGAQLALTVKCNKCSYVWSPNASAVLNRTGCPNCYGNVCKTTDVFVQKARAIHGNKYDYSSVEYKNSSTKVKIRCNIHGPFYTTPTKHVIANCGCPSCSKNKRLTQEEFVKRAHVVHNNNKYQYGVYLSARQKLKIKCGEHGWFSQSPNNHLSGDGCPTCGGRQQITMEKFIQRAHKIHKNKYDYTKAIYTTSKGKVSIICTQHGIFNQIAGNHITGDGCPKCSKTCSKMEQAWLDKIGIPTVHRQIRITLNKQLYKVDGYDPMSNTIYEFLGDYWHGNLNKYLPTDINTVNGKTFSQLNEKTKNRRKIFEKAGYKYIEMWEADWKTYVKQEGIK